MIQQMLQDEQIQELYIPGKIWFYVILSLNFKPKMNEDKLKIRKEGNSKPYVILQVVHTQVLDQDPLHKPASRRSWGAQGVSSMHFPSTILPAYGSSNHSIGGGEHVCCVFQSNAKLKTSDLYKFLSVFCFFLIPNTAYSHSSWVPPIIQFFKARCLFKVKPRIELCWIIWVL